MKFDVVVGNPPYQEKNTTKSTRTTRLYVKFLELAVNLSDCVAMVTPSNWVNDDKHKIHKITNDNFLHICQTTDFFDISIPTVYFIYNKDSAKWEFDEPPKK